jgi:sulfatase modifying factor 1
MIALKLGMKFVEITPGRFTMGSPASEIGRDPDEQLHEVTLTRSYWIANAPVTLRQYRYKDPTHDNPDLDGIPLNLDDFPCAGISLSEAREYCKWLTDQDSDWTYDLPTEAQWEFAARAGTSTRFFWGENEADAARYANTFDLTAMESLPAYPADGFNVHDGFVGASPVRSFCPNRYGLYDVIGNVWEMCKNVAYKYPSTPLTDPQGPATGTKFCVRGGDWLSIPFFARLANRTFVREGDKSETVGFRIIAFPKRSGAIDNGLPSVRTWAEVRQLFTDTDVEHMKDASAKWQPPLDLSEYKSVRTYAMKVYSSVRTDRMPIAPVPRWSGDMKKVLRDWIYSGCPE